MPSVCGPICSVLWCNCAVQDLQMWLVRDYICVCEIKLSSPNQSRVFTRERDKTLQGFCVIKCNPWSFSGYVSLICITSHSLQRLCETFLVAVHCVKIYSHYNLYTVSFPSFSQWETSHLFASVGVLYIFWKRFCLYQALSPCDLQLMLLLSCQGNFMCVSGTSIQHRWNCEVTCRHTLLPFLPSLGSVSISTHTQWVICVFFPVNLITPSMSLLPSD